MKFNGTWQLRLTQVFLGAGIVIVLTVVRRTNAEHEPVHLVTDWSHRHVIFSAPHDLMQQFRLSTDPRYVQQLIRRNDAREEDRDRGRWRRAPEDPDTIQSDWSVYMGSGATVGAGNFPAKFSFNTGTATCATDFVAYNTSLAGSTAQASVVAFNNLYVAASGGGLCGTAPSTYWAYNTGGTVATSLVLSLDGSQVAFVQNNSAGTQATLVLLKWAANSGTIISPLQLTPVTPAIYTTCSGVCMTTFNFATVQPGGTGNPGNVNADDTVSSPFVDYANDTLYVGDSKGYLHKFTNVFHGTMSTPPAETVTTGTWPALVSSGYALTDPVFDNGTGSVFVGSPFGTLKRVDATTGVTVTKTAQIAISGSNFESPILDETNGQLYLIVSKSFAGTLNASAVFTFPTTFTGSGSSTGTQTILSSQGVESNVYSGAFDNKWFLGHAGNMYVCAPTASNISTLYQIAVSTAGVLSTVSTGPALTTGASVCSYVTEFFNPNNTSVAHPAGTDLIFLSVTALAAPVSCTTNAGCLMSFDVTSGTALSASTPAAATRVEAGGTSGIIIDGSSASPGASQVYFTPLGSQICGTGGTGGCAIQASQSGLN
jgi:hypothetical protein